MSPKRKLTPEEILQNEPEEEEYQLGPPPEGIEPEETTESSEETPVPAPLTFDDLGPDEQPDPIDGEPDACVEMGESETPTEALLNTRPETTTEPPAPSTTTHDDGGDSTDGSGDEQPADMLSTAPAEEGLTPPDDAPPTVSTLDESRSGTTSAEPESAPVEPQPAPPAEPEETAAVVTNTETEEEDEEEHMAGRPRCKVPITDLPRPKGRFKPGSWLKKTWSEDHNEWRAVYCEPETKGAVPIPEKPADGKRRRYKKVNGAKVAVVEKARKAKAKAAKAPPTPKAKAAKPPKPKATKAAPTRPRAVPVPQEEATNGLGLWKEMLAAETNLKEIDSELKRLSGERVEAEQSLKDLMAQVKERLGQVQS